MRRFKKTGLLLWIVSVFLLGAVRPAYAAEKEYTYTVRLYAGNQGILKEGGIEVGSQSAKIVYEKECTVISGLSYGDAVYIRPQDTAETTDERYYIRGVRRAGRDNSEALAPTFYAACDRDYVVAYGVKGDMVEYKVNYVDMDGKTLRESDSYYGNIGDRQYVSSRYIANYEPQTLNMVKTLSANAAENVFTFRYAPVAAGENSKTGGGTPSSVTSQTTGQTTTAATNATGGTAAQGQQIGEGGDTDAEQQEEASADDNEAQENEVGGNAGVHLPDDQVPLEQKDLLDLDDEEVPLAAIKAEQAGLMGYFPVYAGIGGMALLALIIAVIYLSVRKRKAFLKQGVPKGRKFPYQRNKS